MKIKLKFFFRKDCIIYDFKLPMCIEKNILIKTLPIYNLPTVLRRKWMKISVPATSANLGPGFDCLGLAISMKNQVIIRPQNFIVYL